MLHHLVPLPIYISSLLSHISRFIHPSLGIGPVFPNLYPEENPENNGFDGAIIRDFLKGVDYDI
jgi:hypothetical protein